MNVTSIFPLAVLPQSAVALLFLLLGAVGCCVLFLTVTVMRTAGELRRTLQRVQLMLPGCDQAIQEARGTLTEARQLLARTNDTTRHVETVIHKTCDAASGMLEHVMQWKDRAQLFVSGRSGNGVKSKPRR